MANRATADRAASPILSVIVSIVFHVGVVVAVLFTFATKLDIPTDSTPLVPVDLVTVGEETNIAPMVKPEDNTPPPEPAMVEPPPQPDVAPPQIEIAPDAKPTPKEKPKTEKKFDINDIQKLLANRKPLNAKTGPQTFQGVGAGTALTADLQSVLASQIYRCWSPPVGAEHAADLVVVYDINLDRAGNVSDKPKLLSDNAALNTPRDAANQAAFRAIYACQPYSLPANRYREWRHFSFRFNPRELVGP